MTFSLMLLGVMLILVIFNVGESMYNRLKIKKWMLLTLIAIFIGLSFVPDIVIGTTIISISGFILPAIISLVLIFSIRKFKDVLKTLLGTLISITAVLIYKVINFNVYESSFLQPYLVLAIIMGIVLFFTCKKQRNVFLSAFLGLMISEFIFYQSRFNALGYYSLNLGGEMFLTVLLGTLVISIFVGFLYRKVVVMRRKSRMRKLNRV